MAPDILLNSLVRIPCSTCMANSSKWNPTFSSRTSTSRARTSSSSTWWSNRSWPHHKTFPLRRINVHKLMMTISLVSPGPGVTCLFLIPLFCSLSSKRSNEAMRGISNTRCASAGRELFFFRFLISMAMSLSLTGCWAKTYTLSLRECTISQRMIAHAYCTKWVTVPFAWYIALIYVHMDTKHC